MHRRQFVAAAAAASATGCTGSFGDEEHGRLDLTVQNRRADPVTVRVEVVDDGGTTLESESDQIDSGVSRSFEVVVGTAGRHEVTASGDDWRGQLAWNADACALFTGTIGVAEESVAVAGECADSR